MEWGAYCVWGEAEGLVGPGLSVPETGWWLEPGGSGHGKTWKVLEGSRLQELQDLWCDWMPRMRDREGPATTPGWELEVLV